MTKEEAKQKVARLVKKYENLSSAEIKKQNEEATKQGFILPLFKGLGWDTEDTANEVIPEEKASKGRVDYAFKLKGVPQFYLEAKPLKADLNNPDYIKQVTTYAYNKGVTWAILTNFSELRPLNAQTGNFFILLSSDKYISDFDDLWLFSKESLEKGLLKERAIKQGALPLPMPVEKRLFQKLRDWRTQLYNELRAYNAGWSPSKIDEVIQRLFSRLIFVRTCEDRGIEGQLLLAAVNQWVTDKRKTDELIRALRQIFRHFDETYDSELFDKHLIDDAIFMEPTIEDIVRGLYEIPGLKAEYNFGDMKPDVLGTVYEQYLGYLATRAKDKPQSQLTLIGQTPVEFAEKKRHRKEQGIYYTPAYITDYIVEQSIGHFTTEHSYEEVRTMRILDPACGSGSFLIRAYDELLDYHAKQHNMSPTELEQKDRLPVLLNNVFGVDLDMQAVEIARLNLLLRTLTQKGKLPFLSDNIRQGNSLISGTPEELKGYFGNSYKEKKPFNWEQEFKDVMGQGGFDVVIGNPPYVQLSMEEKLPPGLKDFLLDTYKSSMGRLNTFGFFIKRGIELLRDGGYLGFIIPNTILTQDYYEELRRSILETCTIETIASFDDLPFKDAVVENAVLILKKNKSEKIRNNNKVVVYKVNEELSFEQDKSITQELFSQSRNCSFNIHLDESLPLLKKKLEESSWPLSKFVNINQAIALKHEREKWVSKTKIDESYKPLLVGGRNINRYSIAWDEHYLHYDKAGIHSGGDEEKFIVKEKIFFRRVSDRLIGALDTNQFYGLHTLVVVTLKEETPFDIRFFLALFNSKLLNFYYQAVFASTKKVFSEIGARQVAQLPVKSINLSIPEDKKMHDALVALVERMLELNHRLAPIRDTYCNERDELITQIEQTDKEIDTLVYDLYGLTEAEKNSVESTVNISHWSSDIRSYLF